VGDRGPGDLRLRHRPRAPSSLSLRYAARFLAAAAFACCAETTRPARADTMDPAVERLVTQPTALPKGFTCQGIAANPSVLTKAPFPKNAVSNSGAYTCLPDNVAFHNLVTEYAFAIAPNAFHPARTTGFGGFAFTVEASYTKINSNASAGGLQYWHLGTQGPSNPNTGSFSEVNQAPDSLLQVYSLKARKGLPFGFEITGDLGYVANTTLWVAGADVRWAVFEGFRTGVLGFLPDISAGGGARTLAGTGEFDLTTVGIDVQLSKPIPLADSSVVSPYVGYQRLYVFGDSDSVNLAPNVNPLTACGYNGNLANGEPNCRNGGVSNFAFNEDAVFSNIRNHRDRGIIGVSYRYEILYLAGQFLIDLVDPSSEDPVLVGARQWTLSFEGGVYF
jgi:hypothetical protein